MDQLFSNKKILWVEDDTFLGGLIGQRFGELGAILFGATDGAKAVEIAEKEKPDIILLDILLPGMNGFEVLEKIRGNESTKNTPVIILSNLSQESDLEKAKALGVSKFLVKATVNLDEIVEEVKKILQV